MTTTRERPHVNDDPPLDMEGELCLSVPDFTRRDVHAATTPKTLARGQELAE
jgi:hypothetical protein